MAQQLCPCGSTDKAVRHGLCRRCRKDGKPTGSVLLDADRNLNRARGENAELRLKYNAALKTIERQDSSLAAIGVLGESVAPFTIEPRLPSGTAEGTAVMVASDWHAEEEVGAEIGGLNTYNLEIETKRATKFFQVGQRLIRLLQQDIKINTLVLALLGDFITGNIHGEENAEKNALSPNDALVFVQNQLISGIEFLLDSTKLNLVLPCHSGNHARTTHTTRFASENGHSLEYLMYLHLAAYFRSNKRVHFQVASGMHSYVQVYDQTLRFHHGHAVKYGGGVGGIYIPVNKAIAQWNKGKRADLDVFGHFHQMRDGGNFICNGSLIGYNAYALSIKADYERPSQALFLMDKKRGRTCTWPILFS